MNMNNQISNKIYYNTQWSQETNLDVFLIPPYFFKEIIKNGNESTK